MLTSSIRLPPARRFREATFDSSITAHATAFGEAYAVNLAELAARAFGLDAGHESKVRDYAAELAAKAHALK